MCARVLIMHEWMYICPLSFPTKNLNDQFLIFMHDNPLILR